MIDYKKYCNNADLEFIENIKECMLDQVDFTLVYKEYFYFSCDPCGDCIDIWSNGEQIGCFQNLEDMFEHFIIDGKPFIEQIGYIDFE